MTGMIDWEAFYKYNQLMTKTESRFIEKVFIEYVENNDSFNDKSSVEMEDYLETFKNAWVLAGIHFES